MTDILTLTQAAALLQCSAETLRQHAARGEIPARRLGVDQSFISLVERGKRPISVELAAKLQALFVLAQSGHNAGLQSQRPSGQCARASRVLPISQQLHRRQRPPRR